MKKLILLFMLISQSCLAQSVVLDSSFPIESCGLDTISFLNDCETDYFNYVLEKQRGDFNFKGKKIAFAYDKYGSSIISKKDYFDMWGKSYHSRGSGVFNQLLILNSKEKEVSGGFDAVIVSWNKMGKHTKKQREKLISRIRKNNRV